MLTATILSQVDLELVQAAPVRVVRRSITFAAEHGAKIRLKRGNGAA